MAQSENHIVITIGYATQIFWFQVARETISKDEENYNEVEYAEDLFHFWEHPFYKAGGVGQIPADWHWLWGRR
jgi:hypothetical protein